MALETPLLRVSRPVAACSRCRAAKVKCDGKLPACTACEKSNRASECSSTNDQFARGKERSYVATLEARVERLDKKIAEARARRKSSTVLMEDCAETATTRRASVDTVKAPKPQSKRAARRKEASDLDELVSDFGLLAVNATARDFYGFTSAMSYSRLILSASSKEELPAGPTKPLPPRFAATPLIQHYLNNIYTLLPLFEEAAFYASVDAVYHADDNATAFDHWSVRMVLAIACLAQSEQRGDALYSDAVGHVHAALEHAEDVLQPGLINNIQALILLVEYAMMDPHHFDSWTLIGAASRTLVDLGIHQDPSRSTPVSRAKLETRRRVYWCVYALDRSTSLVQTRAFSFSDESANVALPFHNPATSPKASPQAHVFQQSFDVALDYFKIREMQSVWYMDLFQSSRLPWSDPYPYIWQTYARMTHWFNDMPSSILPSTRSFFELELLYSYVYILSPSPRIPHICEYAQRLIFEHCIAYATALLAVIAQPSNTTKPPVTFYDAMRAYMTGRQFVDVLSRNLDVILDALPPAPPVSSAPPPAESEDPLSPPAHTPAPSFPSPTPIDGQALQDPTTRAITAIKDFTEILSRFGLRFGFTHWRDRFTRESGALMAQLYRRAGTPTHSPPATGLSPPNMHPTFHAQSWMPSTSPQPGTMFHQTQQPTAATSSQPQIAYMNALHQQQQQQQEYQHGPTTPPTVYPPQPSPFASPYDGSQQQQQQLATSPYEQQLSTSPFDGSQQGLSTSPYEQQLSTSPYENMSDWTTPSPQPQAALSTVPELPQPSGGRVRHALVYGPGLPRA